MAKKPKPSPKRPPGNVRVMRDDEPEYDPNPRPPRNPFKPPKEQRAN